MTEDPAAQSVTVVIPTRNRRALLQRAVESVLRQAGVDLELIVVDDASTDDTWSWLSSFGDHRLKAYRMARQSERAAARNLGLREASGPLVMFLDDDDYLLPAALESLSKAIASHPAAVAVAGSRIDQVGETSSDTYPHPRSPCLLPIWHELVAGWILAQGQYLCRTEVARQGGGWREGLSAAEDVDFWFRLSRKGEVLFIPGQVLCVERAHALRPASSADVGKIWREMRVDFVSRLEPRMKEVGEGILRAAEIQQAGLDAYYDGRFTEALCCNVRAWRTAPELLRSPILGPAQRVNLLRTLAGVVLRKRGLQMAKAFLRR